MNRDFGQLASGLAALPLRPVPQIQENVTGKTISFKRPDGQEVNGYPAEPAGGGPAPGVMLIQEWWGPQEGLSASWT